MGYVYKDTHTGRWYVAYEDEEGRPRRKSARVPTKAAAKKVLSRYELEAAQRRYTGVKRETEITFRSYAARYLRHACAVKTRESANRDRKTIDSVMPILGGKKLAKIRTQDLQKYVDDRIHAGDRRRGGVNGRPISPLAIQRELTTLSAMFRKAIDWDLILANPVKRVDAPKGESKKERYMTDVEETRILAVCRRHPALFHMEDIILSEVHSGLRPGELQLLTWQQVDFELREIVLRKTKSHRERRIPMNDFLFKVLRRLYMKVLRAENSLPARVQDRYVFINPKTGTRYTSWKTAWRSILSKAGIKGLRFYDLRHTFASRLLQSGVNLKCVQDLLGHMEITTTMRYAHLAEGDLKRAVARLVKRPVAQRKGSRKKAKVRG